MHTLGWAHEKCCCCERLYSPLNAGAPVDRVMLQEDQTLGQLVSHFYVIADGQVLFNGTSIGNKLIILLESSINASNVCS